MPLFPTNNDFRLIDKQGSRKLRYRIGITKYIKYMNKKILITFLAICFVCIPRNAYCQWSFHVKVVKKGNGCGRYLWSQVIENRALINNGQLFETEQECLFFQHMDTEDYFEAGDCYVRVDLISPCSSPLKTLGNNTNSINPFGYTQGESSYSSNPANEIKDWNDQHAGLMSLIGGNEQSYRVAQMVGHINHFIWINTSHNWENDYIKIRNVLTDIHAYFFIWSGYDIEKILLKEPKTESDWKIIAQYMNWKQEILKEFALQKEMALRSALVYEKRDLTLAGTSSFTVITSSMLPDDSPVKRLAKLIELCNNEFLNQGFYAELTHNEQTGEYAVAFRGTESPELGTKITILSSLLIGAVSYLGQNASPSMKVTKEIVWSLIDQWLNDLAEGNTDKLPPDLHDIATDISQGFGEVLTQYKMVVETADVIRQIMEENPDIIIYITGHSLGGGEAILAGVVSNAPTYVFNPAGVHPNTFEYAEDNVGLKSRGENIIWFSTDDDLLTNAQESNGEMGTWLNLIAKKTAEHVAKNQTRDELEVEKIVKDALPTAIGNKVVLHTGGNHSIDPIAHQMIEITDFVKQIAKMDETTPECRIYYDENK